MRTRLAIQIVFAALVVNCPAQTNTLQDAILSFPDDYRPDEAIRSANLLIAAGERRAYDALWWAAQQEDSLGFHHPANEKVLLLCRLLFRPKEPDKPIRMAYDGLRVPVDPKDYLRWPDYPFVITNEIPLLLPRFLSSQARLGLALRGPEAAWTYLDVCQRGGVFRSEPFPTPNLLTTSNAVKQVLTSADWQTLNWEDSAQQSLGAAPRMWAEKNIWEQVENMKKPIAAQ